MSVAILRAVTALYALSAAAYVACFARPRHARLAAVGFWVLLAAFLAHAVAIGVACGEYGGREFFGLRGGLVLAAWLGAGAYLFLHRVYRVPTVGAFVTPLLVVVLVPALFGLPGHPGIGPETVRRPILALHIVTAGLGVALFAIACALAAMYLLQEREVKGKRFGALFSRLPSLDALDRLEERLVRAGFVVYTVALVAGTMTAAAVWKSAWSWDPQQVLSVCVWLLYFAMVQLRHTGWRGRRYAVLTVVGFVLVAGTMITLKAVPGITRHAGDYGATVEAGVRP